jgi:hypothetical protein
LSFSNLELEAKISTRLATQGLEKAGTSRLHLQQPRCVQQISLYRDVITDVFG